MLARLRHHSLVGSDDEQCKVDPRGARDHRAHECLMAWDVDDTDGADAIEGERSKSELDGDAAPLLFRQPIGVDAGERVNEGGFVRMREWRCCSGAPAASLSMLRATP